MAQNTNINNNPSQIVRLADYFQNNSKFIDPLEAWLDLGIYRLSARIYNLRKAGFNIITHRKKVKNQWGEEIPVGNYELKSVPATWQP